jgi:putative toxin-antitoxin system antitoxin component (TIGR02293 family)
MLNVTLITLMFHGDFIRMSSGQNKECTQIHRTVNCHAIVMTINGAETDIMTSKITGLSSRQMKEPVTPLWESAGLPAGSGISLLNAIQKGFPVDSINRLNTELGWPKMVLLEIMGINERNYARRKAGNGLLKSDESERVARLVRTIDAATDLFEGDRIAALDWITRPAPALAGSRPLELLSSEAGAVEVNRLIGRLQHGVFS